MTSIDVLSDDVLLDIFNFYANHPSDDESRTEKNAIEAWQLLVHVCRRWRSVVFGSPQHLNLHLVCTQGTTRDMVDIWPPFLLIIMDGANASIAQAEGMDNIVAALERSDRVDNIRLSGPDSILFERLSTAMQEPFPKLTSLELCSLQTDRASASTSVLPNSFLGGSTPHLRLLRLSGVPFPGLLNLLLSATRLVQLDLLDTPHSAYISPEAMAPALSAMTSLKSLQIRFRSRRSHPNQESRPLPPPWPASMPLNSRKWI